MLSRRNVRVKVMQLLYAERQDADLSHADALQGFRRMVDQSYGTLLFDLYAFTRVLHEARDEQKRRAARLLPSEADRLFRPYLYDNPVTLALANAPELAKAAERRKFAELLDEERLRGFYASAKTWDGYDEYAVAEAPTLKDHLTALLKAHKALMDNESYNDFIEDRYARWEADKSLVIGAAKKVLKSLPGATVKLTSAGEQVDQPFLAAYQTDDETAERFGAHLLEVVLSVDERLLAYVQPVLKNWDAERVAVLDMVLIKMALGELLEFSEIPPKVTLNEYVELAKTYSTDKSKEFINGVLDALLKSLQKEGLIVKEGRGLID